MLTIFTTIIISTIVLLASGAWIMIEILRLDVLLQASVMLRRSPPGKAVLLRNDPTQGFIGLQVLPETRITCYKNHNTAP